MTAIALLRHGHTAWNREGRLQGRTDIELDPQAIADLSDLCLPMEWRDADIVSSPLKRAVQTAECIAQTPTTDPRLTEMDWGEWEGAHGRHLRADPSSGYLDIENWGWEYRPPGGESVSELRTRVMDWVLAVRRRSVVVCHIGVMRVLLAEATGWAFNGPAPFAIKRNRLYVLETNSRLFWDGTPVRLVKR